MTIYEENIKLMKNNEKFLQSIQGKPVIEREVSFDCEANNFTTMYNERKYWLFNSHYSESELDQLFNNVPFDAELVILFGVGRGEIFKYFRKFCPKTKNLIIIEPIQKVFQQFITDYSIAKVFSGFSQVSFIVNQEQDEFTHELKRILYAERYFDLQWGFLAQISYKNLFPEYEKNIVQTLFVQRRFQRVNENTNWALQRRWTMNFWRNFSQNSIEADAFKKIFKNKTAIIVSAGPSLQKNIDLLPEAKNKAIIIAVGSAISILENRGIKPHFRMAIDPMENNNDLFACLPENDNVPLFFAFSFFFPALAQYSGPKVHMALNAGGAIASYFSEKLYKKRTHFRSGFTVANVAYDVAAQLGCSKIVLIGQDLCYTDGRLHAQGAWDEGFEEKFIHEEMKAIDIFGNVVGTDSAFLGMREVFEVFIKLHSANTECINASEGGLPIKGAPNRTLLDTLSEIETLDKSIEKEIACICQNELQRAQLSRKIIKKEVSEFIRKVGRIHQAYVKLIQYYQQILLLIEKGEFTDDAAFSEKLEPIYKQIEKHEFYKKIILPVYKEGHMRRRKEMLGDNAVTQKERMQLILKEASEIEEIFRMNFLMAKEFCGESVVNISFED